MSDAAHELFQIRQDFKEDDQRKDCAHIKPRQGRLPKTQGKVGGLLAKTEQGKKLLPVECDNDEQSHKRKHFKETVHVLFGRRHLPPAVGVAHVPNCRGLGSEVDSLLFEKKTAWGRMASEKAL